MVVVEPKDLGRVAEAHSSIDLVATEEVPNLGENVSVIVPKGSGVLEGHSNRLEV